MTIRFRIIIYYSSLLIGILGVFGGAVFGILKWTMLSQVDTSLLQALDEVKIPAILNYDENGQATLLISPPKLDEFRTPGIYIQIWENGATEPYSASDSIRAYIQPLDPEALGSTEEVRSDVTIEGTHFRVITRPIKINVNGQVFGSVQAATSLNTIEEATDRLLKIMLGGGVIALLVSLMLGDWLAQRVLLPVEAIVSTAQHISQADDLSRRIAYRGPQDELGRMVSVFNETLTRLEKLFNAQRRFVADVSHELRTPLTTIQGNLDLLRRYGNDPRSIQAIESESKRMSRLVGDLLMLAQADAGQIPMKISLIDLDALVLEVYNEAVLLSRKTHHVKLGAFEQVQVNGDMDRLKQLLLNLVTNAIKYTPEGGSIEVTLTKTETEAQVRVSDTGIGIPAEDLEHIFDRFYRVDKARSRAAGGTGLGLSIAHWIAEAHHGRIEVASQEGIGTTFTLILPVAVIVVEQPPVVTVENRALERP